MIENHPVKNRRILVVDDNLAIHEDFKKALNPSRPDTDMDMVADLFLARAPAGEPPAPEAGFEIDSAHQGLEAISMVEASLAEGQPYALAFVDMRMPPGCDGLETLKGLFALDSDMAAVICTAYTDHTLETIHSQLDAGDRLLVLKKPFDMIEVRQLAFALSERWAMQRETMARVTELERVTKELQAELASMRSREE